MAFSRRISKNSEFRSGENADGPAPADRSTLGGVLQVEVSVGECELPHCIRHPRSNHKRLVAHFGLVFWVSTKGFSKHLSWTTPSHPPFVRRPRTRLLIFSPSSRNRPPVGGTRLALQREALPYARLRSRREASIIGLSIPWSLIKGPRISNTPGLLELPSSPPPPRAARVPVIRAEGKSGPGPLVRP